MLSPGHEVYEFFFPRTLFNFLFKRLLNFFDLSLFHPPARFQLLFSIGFNVNACSNIFLEYVTNWWLPTTLVRDCKMNLQESRNRWNLKNYWFNSCIIEKRGVPDHYRKCATCPTPAHAKRVWSFLGFKPMQLCILVKTLYK